jgi:hypothetical protein
MRGCRRRPDERTRKHPLHEAAQRGVTGVSNRRFLDGDAPSEFAAYRVLRRLVHPSCAVLS